MNTAQGLISTIKGGEIMPKVIDVTIESHIQEVKEAAKIDILAWLDAIGEDAAETAAQVAPVDTGELKNSISHAVDDSDNTVYIGTNVPYAKWHEFGTGIYAESGGRQTPWKFQDREGKWHYTRGVPAKHFLKFGATAHQKEYKQALEMFLRGESL